MEKTLQTPTPTLTSSSILPTTRKIRVAYFVSHPIQYQAPLLRLIAAQPEIELKTYFFSDFSTRSYVDPGFGVAIQWDVPLLDGYQYEFLPTLRDRGRLGFVDPICHGIWNTLYKGNFDAVWLHGYHTLNHLNVLMAARALRLPVLLRTDSSLTDRHRSNRTLFLKSAFFRALRSTVKVVLTVGTANSQYWKEYLPEVPQSFMPYAVDNESFQAKAVEASNRREELRTSLNLSAERPIILFASKLQSRKRCIDLVEAYIKLSDQTLVSPRPYLLIIGDGEEYKALKEHSGDRLGKDILMLGFRNQSELPGFFDLCDVFVLPSIWEPFGLIVNEVMNAARPVIVSDQVGCHSDLVQHSHTGMVFPAKDIDALEESLRYVLENPDRAREMGRRGLELIQRSSLSQNVAALKGALSTIGLMHSLR